MHLDLPTLLIADSFVTAMSGALLIFVWFHDRNAAGVLWWGLANIGVAIGTGIYGSEEGLPDLVPRIIVAISLTLASSLFWAAAYRCNHPRVPLALILAAPAAWLATLAIPGVIDHPSVQMALVTLSGVLYSPAGAFEMWRGRSERLVGRWPLFGLLVFDGAISLAGTVAAASGELTPLTLVPVTSAYGLIYFDTFLLCVGGGIFMVLFARERAELVQKAAAHVDVLTGLANRRAFLERANAHLQDSLRNDRALSLIFFDLDHFKSINDVHGHATGDRVLQTFGDAAQPMLRASDVIGRIGGEEFAIVLPGLSSEAAYVIAERIRVAFTSQCRSLDERGLAATVSAGIAAAHSWSTLDSLLHAADEALYRAKSLGRNRVERPVAGDRPGSSNLIRIG